MTGDAPRAPARWLELRVRDRAAPEPSPLLVEGLLALVLGHRVVFDGAAQIALRTKPPCLALLLCAIRDLVRGVAAGLGHNDIGRDAQRLDRPA
jgi:hypothetical protein